MKKLLKVAYLLGIPIGFIALYLMARPIGPIREIGMWAALCQMFTCILFGLIVGLEMQISTRGETK